MNLEHHQRGLLDLVKGRGSPPPDPYLRSVAASEGLAIARGSALFWRAFQLETQCRYTARLLKQLESFDDLVGDYFDNNPTSPFIEELSRGFLRSLNAHEDVLVHAVSQFELAVLRVKDGSAEAFETLWDRHPDLVFLALETGGGLPGPDAENYYLLRIDGALSDMVTCSRLPRRREPERHADLSRPG
jgi:hypothetical protein